MKQLMMWLYTYLTWKPQAGALSGGFGYIMAMKVTPAMPDDTLKLIATVSAIAGCFVACMTALSWVLKCALWCHKTVTLIIVKCKTPNSK